MIAQETRFDEGNAGRLGEYGQGANHLPLQATRRTLTSLDLCTILSVFSVHFIRARPVLQGFGRGFWKNDRAHISEFRMGGFSRDRQ
jgi:hypothetical protein